MTAVSLFVAPVEADSPSPTLVSNQPTSLYGSTNPPAVGIRNVGLIAVPAPAGFELNVIVAGPVALEQFAKIARTTIVLFVTAVCSTESVVLFATVSKQFRTPRPFNEDAVAIRPPPFSDVRAG
jgi:hypothetical protein